MELLIIQYSIALPLGIYLVSLPLRIVLIMVDIPKTLWLTINKRKWKRF